MDQAIIIGAGFSFYAGLPLQAEFTKQLLQASHYTKGPSKRLVDYLCPFVSDTFHPREKHDPDRWPDLEDLFTCIDLSANSGHHLGNRHSPGALRTVRRALIARTIRMLHQAYKKKQNKPDENWRALESLLAETAPETNAFISLNWDTVAEERMLELHHGTTVHYGTGFTPACFPSTGSKIRTIKPKPTAPNLRVAKIHGSINWLYCDNCRNVYWFNPNESLRIADQILSKDEWKRIAPTSAGRAKEQLECPACDGVVLTTRIATFSYRKALDFPMFHQSWNNAEHILKEAERWVFIGYSLPAADFEFKYLLKRVELARRKPPDVIVITGGDAATTTRNNYRHFFGTRLNKSVYNNGLTDKAIRKITT